MHEGEGCKLSTRREADDERREKDEHVHACHLQKLLPATGHYPRSRVNADVVALRIRGSVTASRAVATAGGTMSTCRSRSSRSSVAGPVAGRWSAGPSA